MTNRSTGGDEPAGASLTPRRIRHPAANRPLRVTTRSLGTPHARTRSSDALRGLARSLCLALTLPLVLCACGDQRSLPIGNAPADEASAYPGPIQPLPRHVDLDVRQVELGRHLFADKRLSGDGTLACASCHPVDHYGVDNLRVSVGIRGQSSALNAPTVFNSGFNFRQFWDGRAADLEAQAGEPITNPVEMGATWPGVLGRLAADSELTALSKGAYGVPIDERVVRSALATYERSLITPDAPFDRYLRGDPGALGADAEAGWRLFRELGCSSCHQGINVGANMYSSIGVMDDYFGGRALQPADLGLFNRTGRERDRSRFKVPSLRNVEMTAPYFHDGRVATLEEAVDVMARTQLGLRLRESDRRQLVAFLKSLTGRPPALRP
jgi:cytochrome c peroxidase